MWLSRHFGKISAALGGGLAVFAAVREGEGIPTEEIPQISSLEVAVHQSQRQIALFREETGIPGLSVAVEIDGHLVWTDGVGFSDVENHTPCFGNTVMRIASISKPITMALVGRLWQEGLLDIDKPIHYYVPEFTPKPGKNGHAGTSPSLRQLASHLGGVRHYRPVEEQRKVDIDPSAKHTRQDDSVHKEFYSKHRFNGVRDSLAPFKDDELVYPPGQRFLYTTYGYSLLGAAAEVAGGRPLPVLYKQLFRHLGLNHTHLDDPLMVITNRSRHYIRTKEGRLENAPYVDNSNKWAGGGLLSNAVDVARFGSLMLRSYQCGKPGTAGCENTYLSNSVMRNIWTPVDRTHCWHKNGRYAMGWCVIEPPKNNYPAPAHPLLDDNRPIFTHSGGAVGGTSILLVLPSKPSRFARISKHFSSLEHQKTIISTVKAAESHQKAKDDSVTSAPHGISVAVLANLQGVHGLGDLALDIALRFDRARNQL